MGFLSRKKPKPAPVEVQEEHPIIEELQRMEKAVPERIGQTSRDEGGRPAGPVSDPGIRLAAEPWESSPPAGEAVEAEPSEIVVEEMEPSEEVEDGVLEAP